MSRLSFGSLYTHREFAPVVLRIIIGLIFLLHGWQKITDIPGVTEFFTGLGIPLAPVMAWVVALVETFGGIALILGAFTRLSAMLLAVVMLVVVLYVKGTDMLATGLPLGLIGQKSAELELSLFAGCVALAILGGGKWALDRRIFGQERD